jgi:predicted permease
MDGFIEELKLAQASLRDRPGFVLTVMLTLGLTLGALIAIFNLNYLLLMKPLPYPEQQRLVAIDNISTNDGLRTPDNSRLLPATVHHYQQQINKPQPLFEQMAIFKISRLFLSSHASQPRLPIIYATPEYFELLGTPMQMGRAFSQAEGFGQHNPVVVLSFAAWQQWFNGADDIVGQKIQLGETRFSVIGVTAKAFHQPEVFTTAAQIWLPWDFNDYHADELSNWNNSKRNIAAIARLKADVPLLQTQSLLNTAINDHYQRTAKNPNDNKADDSRFESPLVAFHTRLMGDSQSRALLLMASVAGLLLIACSNVINLFYSRAAEKQQTFAIQAALGARRSHLFKAMFAESLLMTVASGLLGLLVAAWGFELLKRLGEGQLSRLSELALDGTTLAFTALMAVLLAMIFALLSSRVVNYDALKEQLQSSGKGSGLQISTFARNVLVISQITLTTLLLAGAFVVLQQAYSVVSHPLGFNDDNLYSLSIDARANSDSQNAPEAKGQLINTITDKLSQLPQVQTVSPSFRGPIGVNMAMSFSDTDNNNLGFFPVNFVSKAHFKMMEVTILQGRMFTASEIKDQSKVVVVSRTAAQRFAKDGNALGINVFTEPGNPRKVIGIVEDTFDPNRRQDAQGKEVFLPYEPWNMHWLIKFNPHAQLSKLDLINQLTKINPSLKVARYDAIANEHQQALTHNKLNAGVAGGLTLLALLLASVGLYGVLSYSSQMRRYELGIRMALGARTGQITALVIRDNSTPIVIGIGLSMILTLLLYGLARQHIASVSDLPVLPLLMTLPVIIFTALIASYLPVRKIINEDPVKALRNE